MGDPWDRCFAGNPNQLQRLFQYTNMTRVPGRPMPPAEGPPEETDILERAMAHLDWWRSVDKWLRYLFSYIEKSLEKTYAELAAWNQNYSHLPLPERVNSGISTLGEEAHICATSCDCSVLSGGYYLPSTVGIPGEHDLKQINDFFQYHRNEMIKHFDHMMFLGHHIETTLLKVVANKIEHLMSEIDVLEMVFSSQGSILSERAVVRAGGYEDLNDTCMGLFEYGYELPPQDDDDSAHPNDDAGDEDKQRQEAVDKGKEGQEAGDEGEERQETGDEGKKGPESGDEGNKGQEAEAGDESKKDREAEDEGKECQDAGDEGEDPKAEDEGEEATKPNLGLGGYRLGRFLGDLGF